MNSLTSHFELQTEKFGTVKVNEMSVGAIEKFIKRMPDYKYRPGREVALACISIIIELENETKVNVTQLTELELTEYADKYLEIYSQINNSEGESILAVERAEGEAALDYMGRVIVYEIINFNDSIVNALDQLGIMKASKEIDSLSSLLKDDPALLTIKGIHNAKDSLYCALKDIESFQDFENPAMQKIKHLQKQQELYDRVFPSYIRDAQKMQSAIKYDPELCWREEMIKGSTAFKPQELKIPPNPIHKTNKKLDDLDERMDAFTKALAGHLEASAIAVQEIASEIKVGSTGTSKQNWLAIGIAALSLFVAVAGFFKDSFQSRPTDMKQPAEATAPAAISRAPVRPPAPANPAMTMTPDIPEKQTPNPNKMETPPKGSAL
ncbi:MAG: hypothetical protein P4L42_14565 [Desulfocapsaceae bacterium]|nr:hypothetical protein [Desulfocapsaceae bacterium]